jgi:dTDP-glucose pyrophosphorylase
MSSSNTEMLLIGAEASLREAIQVIDAGGKQIALMVGATGVLEGVVTDGDIRRALLAGRVLTDSVSGFESHEFLSAQENETRESMLKRMREHSVHQLPVLNSAGELVDLVFLDELLQTQKISADVIIMAGGRGVRLGSLTDHCPKPMLEIVGKPILEHIIHELTEQGFVKIALSVNYLKHQIIDYFGDGSSFNAEISYIEESKPLGTGGALSLYKPQYKNIVVINGDVLTGIDFRSLLRFHENEGSDCTVCVQSHRVEVPYGVFELDDHDIVSLVEKPVLTQFVNAGIYVLKGSLFNSMEPEERFDMTDLLLELMEQNSIVKAFPLHESWIDIGERAQLDKAAAYYKDE